MEIVILQIRDGRDEIPIIVRLEEKYREKPEDLLRLNITFRDMSTGQLKTVPLASIARVENAKNYNGINRKQQRRVVTLYSGLVKGYNGNIVNADLKRIIDDVRLSDGYEIKQGGAQEDQAETGAFLLKAFFGAAIAIMFLVIVIQFNSSTKPLIIFSTIVFSLSGVFLGYAISGRPFVIAMSGVGATPLQVLW